MKRICVFAGSNRGTNPAYEEAAINLGKALVEHGLECVYGGSSIGLMGSVANTVLEKGGRAIGVMPTGLFRGEMVHKGLTTLYEVNNMHERKAKMGELSDAFIALPGGYGTLEEVFEAVSWGQLGIHQKPVGLLNVDGYYQPILDMVAGGVKSGFIHAAHAQLITADNDPHPLIQRLKAYQPPAEINKWSELSPEK